MPAPSRTQPRRRRLGRRALRPVPPLHQPRRERRMPPAGRPRRGTGQARRPRGPALPLRRVRGQRLRLRRQHRQGRARGRGHHPDGVRQAHDRAAQVRAARGPVHLLAAAPVAQRGARPPAPPAADAGRGGAQPVRAVQREPRRGPHGRRGARDAARGSAHRGAAAPRDRSLPGRDRRAAGADGELDPRPAPSRPPGAPVAAASVRVRARDGQHRVAA